MPSTAAIPSALTPVSSRLVTVTTVAAALTLVTVMMGSVVAATDSSSACPAWPQCYPDRISPGLHATWVENPAIEMFHRAVSGLCMAFLAAAGWLGRRHPDPRLGVLPWVALAGAAAAAVFGMITVLWTLPVGLAMLDVGGALVALAAIVVAAVAARAGTERRFAGPTADERRVGRTAMSALGVLILVHVLGVVVAGTSSDGYRSFTRVIGWPAWRFVVMDHSPALQVARWVLVAIALALLLVTVRGLARRGRRTWAGLLAALVGAELAMSVVISVRGLADAQTAGLTPPLAISYVVVAVAIIGVASVPAAPALAPHGHAGPGGGRISRRA